MSGGYVTIMKFMTNLLSRALLRPLRLIALDDLDTYIDWEIPTLLKKKIAFSKPGGVRKRGRPPTRWLDNVEKDLRIMNCANWRAVASDRQE